MKGMALIAKALAKTVWEPYKHTLSIVYLQSASKLEQIVAIITTS